MTTLHLAPRLPGEMVGSTYLVECVLGQGGMGVVVGARHVKTGARVAVKFLHGVQRESVDRFLREARAAAMVKSKHVCRVIDVGRLESNEPYLVMEHLEGIDLAEKLEIEGPQASADVCVWIIEACHALYDVHGRGIVHRDLKPANIFLHARGDDEPCTKVLDFGISKLPSLGVLTRSATIMGSPLYMSPEQVESTRDVDERADIWSLGVVMYELLTGTTPFPGPSLVQLSNQVRRLDPPLVSTLAEGIPEALAHVVSRCLAKSPADRFANVVELATALAPFADTKRQGLVDDLVSRARRRRMSRRLAIPTLSVIAGVTLIALAIPMMRARHHASLVQREEWRVPSPKAKR